MTSQESRGPNGFQAAAPPPKTADRHLLERRMGKKVEESGWEGNAKLLNDPALGQLQFPAGVISGTVSPHSEKPPLPHATGHSPYDISSLHDVTNTGLSHWTMSFTKTCTVLFLLTFHSYHLARPLTHFMAPKLCSHRRLRAL